MTAVSIPNYVAGTWTIDAYHSEIGFWVRHLMVSKVRGKFETFTGTITTADNPLDTHAEAEIDFGSISTGNEHRDNDLRSAAFFDSDKHPKMTFRSTSVRPDGEDFAVDGELTIRGITKPITLEVEIGGIGPDGHGGTKLGLSATGEINRHDFGITFNGVVEGGGAVISDKVTLTIEVEAQLQK